MPTDDDSARPSPGPHDLLRSTIANIASASSMAATLLDQIFPPDPWRVSFTIEAPRVRAAWTKDPERAHAILKRAVAVACAEIVDSPMVVPGDGSIVASGETVTATTADPIEVP